MSTNVILRICYGLTILCGFFALSFNIGREFQEKKDSGNYSSALEEQSQKYDRDCKKEIDETIQACMDVMLLECGDIKMPVPEERLKDTDL